MGDTIKDIMRIECPAATAFDLMADARNELKWNSGVSQVELISDEPIGKGSRFSVTDKRGRHEVEITAYQRPQRLSFSLYDQSMDVDIDFTLSQEDKVTVMTGRFNARGKASCGFFFLYSFRSYGAILRNSTRNSSRFAKR